MDSLSQEDKQAYYRHLEAVRHMKSLFDTSRDEGFQDGLMEGRAEGRAERKIIVKRIQDGIKASSKKSGRKSGTVDKMTDELKEDIQRFLKDRTIKQIDLMKKHNISRNTLKKYIAIVSAEETI